MIQVFIETEDLIHMLKVWGLTEDNGISRNKGRLHMVKVYRHKCNKEQDSLKAFFGPVNCEKSKVLSFGNQCISLSF